MTFSQQYGQVLRNCMVRGAIETNVRTKTRVRIAKQAQHLNFDLGEYSKIPLPGNRTIWPHVAAAEVAWQFLGTQDPEFIMKHAPKIWGKFIEDGKLKAAYGYRWKHAFNRNQLALAIEALNKDPSNRQIFISSWDPSCDGLGEPNQPKNIPCPLGFTLNIIDGCLNMSVLVRSSDVYVGLPYDVLGYALMLDAIASSLSVSRGNLSFTLAHAHVYEPHWKHADEDLRTSWHEHITDIDFPGLSIDEILSDPDAYVQHFKSMKINNFRDPKPEVIE